MMSDPASVDRTAFDELTGKLVLVIDESRPWHDAKSMQRQLSAKVKHYVRYIRSESFAGEHGQRPQDTIVRLVSAQPPAAGSLEFFKRIAYELGKNGIDFEYQVGREGIPILVGSGAAAMPPPVTGPLTKPGRPLSARPPPVQKPSEEARETRDVAQAPEAAGTELDAEFIAAFDEALETLDAGSAKPWEAAAIDEVLEAEPAEPPDAAETAEPAEVAEPAEPMAQPEPASRAPADEPADAGPGFASPETLEQPVLKPVEWAEYLDEGPSELEMLIEAPNDVASRFIGLDEPPVGTAPDEPPEQEQTRPPFFPEEEFGRAPFEPNEVGTLLRGVDSGSFGPAIIETPSGKRIRLDVPAASPARQAAEDARPNLGRAITAALGAAIVGAVAWAALAIPAGQGASPLAVAVALMVGMSVRLRGDGHTNAFRLVGCLGTIFGSALGGLLATAALTGWADGQGLDGVVNLFISPAGLWAAVDTYFDTIDLVSLVIAVYIAFKISASSPAE